jgi:ABC-type uncharacterized transport system substrate-binding protein
MIVTFHTCVDSIRTIPFLQHDPDRAEDIMTDSEDHAADEWRYACMSRPCHSRWGLNRPGGNLTGVSFLSPALEAKRVELLRQLVPTATTIAVLVNPSSPGAEARLEDVREAARLLGQQVRIVNARSEGDFEAAFAGLVQLGAGAPIVVSDPLFNNHRDELTALTARRAIPAIYFDREFALAGGLMSYGTNIADAYRQLGVYAGRILKSEKPADLPVVQPIKFELVINLRTAKALGLNIPDKLIALADEVIE